MAYTVQQFLDLKHAPQNQAQVGGQMTCGSCAVELRENFSGYRFVEDGPRCSDCYFAELSDALERYPIGLPGIRR